jgi:hypothetical protein
MTSSDAATSERRSVRPIIVGLVALVASLAFVVFELARADWDPTHFAAFGEDAVEISQYAEERLGEVSLRPQLGHDGRFFFVQANDPWVLDPEGNAMILDRPLYRSQRMLYPLLASGMGSLGPEGIVWGLLLVNVLALGLGSWAVAVVASEIGASSWLGLAFLLNIGFISELNIDGAGIVAGAAAFGAIALFLRDRFAWGVALLTCSALAREVMLVVGAGSAWWLWRYRGERVRALVVLLVPTVAVAIWGIYLRLQIGWDDRAAGVEEIGLPFVGFTRAFSSWLADPLDLVAGLAILVLLLLLVRHAVSGGGLLAWAFVGFAAVGVVLTEQVWRRYFDVGRAMAPAITAFVLLVMASRHHPRVDVSETVSDGVA